MDLPVHTRERVAELRALHQPVRKWLPWLRWLRRPVDVCILCRQTYPCRQVCWCDDVESGTVAAAGWRR